MVTNTEPYTCNLDPDTKTRLEVYLYKDVKNVENIRQNIINGSWKCSVIKPSLIVNMFQVAVAANRAVLAEKSQTMITKTVYSELLYNLSLTKNISQSLSKFGIEKDDSILVCFLIDGNNDVSQEILKEIDGEQCPISSLNSFTNMKDVKSTYKLNNLKSEVCLLDIIVSKMVTKSFVNH
ncbi:EKC/KEOPS complex subunit Tprkb-like [Bicyclus anynana]|uniref:EKC/KEOPS complex subunit Tprkb-like n=1 Tax=Bicyclus anynana TaxID=110368 RepID=A0A6J1NRH5_BICAN|nr:EKC/KEOPS complex subunit Tprkb-like [Bicyclus anynana]